jgi:hypothetical protein
MPQALSPETSCPKPRGPKPQGPKPCGPKAQGEAPHVARARQSRSSGVVQPMAIQRGSAVPSWLRSGAVWHMVVRCCRQVLGSGLGPCGCTGGRPVCHPGEQRLQGGRPKCLQCPPVGGRAVRAALLWLGHPRHASGPAAPLGRQHQRAGSTTGPAAPAGSTRRRALCATCGILSGQARARSAHPSTPRRRRNRSWLPRGPGAGADPARATHAAAIAAACRTWTLSTCWR